MPYGSQFIQMTIRRRTFTPRSPSMRPYSPSRPGSFLRALCLSENGSRDDLVHGASGRDCLSLAGGRLDALDPEDRSMKRYKISKVEVPRHAVVRLTYDDGFSGEVDFAD